jgi:hypothetical protein
MYGALSAPKQPDRSKAAVPYLNFLDLMKMVFLEFLMKRNKIVLLFVWLGFFCSNEIPVIKYSDVNDEHEKAWEKYYESIPALKPVPYGGVLKIRVKRVYDSRMEDFSEDQYQKLYRQIESDIAYYLNYKIQIVEAGNDEILHYFRKYRKSFLKPQYKYLIGGHILDPEMPGDQTRLKLTIEEALKNKPWETIKAYVDSPEIKNKNIPLLTEYFYSRFISKYQEIGNIPANEGIEKLRMGEYGLTQNYNYWSTILNETQDADLFITNSIIAAADDQMPLYVINRGGITTGLTENNIHNPYQGAVLLTLMPFISESEFFKKERGNISENILLPVISMLAVHEFGHYLRRFAENYGQPVTPQNAPVDLRYQDWYYSIINGKNMASGLERLEKF